MARYHGRNAVVYMSTSGTGTAVNQADLSEWSLDFSRDKVDVTAFGDTNKTYVTGLKDVKGTFAGFFDDSTTATLFTASDSSDGCLMYLYPSSSATTRYFYGPAWVDASVSAAVGDAVKVSGSISANGAWGFVLS